MTVSSIINMQLKTKGQDLEALVHSLTEQVSQYNDKNEDTHYGLGAEIAIVAFDKTDHTIKGITTGVPVVELNKEEQESFKPRKGKGKMPFAKFESSLIPGDVIAMFSDGITDQFDVNNKKRLGSKRTIGMVKRSLGQESFLSQWEAWKGNTEQIDDVSYLSISI